MSAAPVTTDAEAVVERHGRADTVPLGGFERERNRHAVIHQVTVRKQHSFREAGGAGRVLDIGCIGGDCGARVEIGSAGEYGVPGRFAQPDDVLQRKALAVARFIKNFPVVGPSVLGAKEQGADAGLLQNVAEFVTAIGGIDVDQDDAGAGGSILKQDPLEAVAGPDPGAVTGL